MPAEAETLAVFLLFDAAKAHTMKSFSSLPGVIASMVMLLPVTVAPAPIEAVFVMLSTFRPTAAPMLVSAEPLSAVPIAFAVAETVLLLLTVTAPVEVIVFPAPIVEVVVERAQLTEIAAATPTPPLSESPVLLLDWLFALSALSEALGSEPSVLPLVDWLPSTFCEEVLSASLLLLSAPFAAAVV